MFWDPLHFDIFNRKWFPRTGPLDLNLFERKIFSNGAFKRKMFPRTGPLDLNIFERKFFSNDAFKRKLFTGTDQRYLCLNDRKMFSDPDQPQNKHPPKKIYLFERKLFLDPLTFPIFFLL